MTHGKPMGGQCNRCNESEIDQVWRRRRRKWQTEKRVRRTMHRWRKSDPGPSCIRRFHLRYGRAEQTQPELPKGKWFGFSCGSVSVPYANGVVANSPGLATAGSLPWVTRPPTRRTLKGFQQLDALREIRQACSSACAVSRIPIFTSPSSNPHTPSLGFLQFVERRIGIRGVACPLSPTPRSWRSARRPDGA